LGDDWVKILIEMAAGSLPVSNCCQIVNDRGAIIREAKMPAYYIGEHKITNAAVFEEYLVKVVPMIERCGGRYLTRTGTHEVLEGNWQPNRVVIVEFPDMASIRRWYEAPDYQPLIALRQTAATDVMIMLDGM
jgi:uncharacterized protein (DUF1330 family)